MINRLTIRSDYPDMRAAHAATLVLEAAYLKTFKRKAVVDLALASTSKPFLDDRGRARMGVERIEVTAVYDGKDPAQVAEAAWFKTQAAL